MKVWMVYHPTPPETQELEMVQKHEKFKSFLGAEMSAQKNPQLDACQPFSVRWPRSKSCARPGVCALAEAKAKLRS